MNRILKAFSLLSLIVLTAACKSDDDTIVPPRDYGVQYTAEKVLIEEYLKSHYFTLDPVTLEATFFDLPTDGSKQSIWDQQEFPLKSIPVTRNDVDYTVYYLSFRDGEGKQPTMADAVTITYKGTSFEGKQFDYQPITSSPLALPGLITGWWTIIPQFKGGTYVDVPGEPASFTNFGAGAMFLPSGLAYFNSAPNNLISAYSPLIFSFQLMDVTYTDIDGDGILNRYEGKEGTNPATGLPYTLEEVDTDGDEIPDYLDTDDDDDGRLTRDEIRIPGTTNQYYPFDEIPVCSETGLKVHLDKNLQCVIAVD